MFRVVPILQIPNKVDFKHIKSNRKLLSNEQIQFLNKLIQDGRLEKGRNKKASINKILTEPEYQAKFPGLKNFDFSVHYENNELYAIYYGVTRGKALGKGAYGKAKLIQNLGTSKWFVKKTIESPQGEKARHELRALHSTKKLSGETLPEDYKSDHVDALITSKTRKKNKFGISKDQLEILIPYIKGSTVADGSQKEIPKLPLIYLFPIAINICQSLLELHAEKWIHRDIHPENVMINFTNMESSIIDLGMSLEFDRDSPMVFAKNFYYTAYYSPESLRKKEFSPKSDIYSLGLVLGILFDLVEFPQSQGGKQYGQLIDKSSLRYLSNMRIPDKNNRDAIYALLKQMLNKNPDDRPMISDIIDFFENFKIKQLAKNSRLVNVGYVEPEKLKSIDNFAELIASLKQNNIHEVFLLDSEANHQQQHDPLYYPKIQHELEKAGILVHDELVLYPHSKTPEQAIKAHSDERAKITLAISTNNIVSPLILYEVGISNGMQLAGYQPEGVEVKSDQDEFDNSWWDSPAPSPPPPPSHRTLVSAAPRTQIPPPPPGAPPPGQVFRMPPPPLDSPPSLFRSPPPAYVPVSPPASGRPARASLPPAISRHPPVRVDSPPDSPELGNRLLPYQFQPKFPDASGMLRYYRNPKNKGFFGKVLDEEKDATILENVLAEIHDQLENLHDEFQKPKKSKIYLLEDLGNDNFKNISELSIYNLKELIFISLYEELEKLPAKATASEILEFFNDWKHKLSGSKYVYTDAKPQVGNNENFRAQHNKFQKFTDNEGILKYSSGVFDSSSQPKALNALIKELEKKAAAEAKIPLKLGLNK